MAIKEFKNTYSDEFINSFTKDGHSYTHFNEYDEENRRHFYDYCFNLCLEENADISEICRFAESTISGSEEQSNFLKLCTRMADVSEKNAVEIFDYFKNAVSWDFGSNADRFNYHPYFAEFIKKYPQTFFNYYAASIVNNYNQIGDLAKIVNAAPETAPEILSFIYSEADRLTLLKGSRFTMDSDRLFSFAEQIAKEHSELIGELTPLLNKALTVKRVESDQDEEGYKTFVKNREYLAPSVFSALANTDFTNYLQSEMPNSKMAGEAFALLFKYNDYLKEAEPDKTEENRRVFSNILENRIKNRQIRAVDCLEARGFSPRLYNLIIENAQKEIDELKYDDISKVSELIECYRPNLIDKKVDVLNLLKLADKIVEHVEFEVDCQTYYRMDTKKHKTFCSLLYPLKLQGAETLSETPKVIFSMLDKLTSLKGEDFAYEAHLLLRAQAEAGLIPVADLLNLSERMTENGFWSDSHTLGSVMHFYEGVLEKDPSLSDRILSLVEKHFCARNTEHLYTSDLESIGNTFSKMIVTKPEMASKLLELYTKSFGKYKDCLSFFKMAMPRTAQLNNMPMNKEAAADIVKLTRILMQNIEKSFQYPVDGLPNLINLCERAVQFSPEYSSEVLLLLIKYKYNFISDERKILEAANNRILRSPKINQKQTLLEVMNSLTGTYIGNLDFLTEFGNCYSKPAEFLHIVKPSIDEIFWSDKRGIALLNTLINRGAEAEPEIKELLPKMAENYRYRQYDQEKNIYNLHVKLYLASKDNFYLKSLRDFGLSHSKITADQVELLQQTVDSFTKPEDARLVLDIMVEQVKHDFSHGSSQTKNIFMKTCETMLDKRLLPANEVFDYIFSSCSGEYLREFRELCSDLHQFQTKYPFTAPIIMRGLIKTADKKRLSWDYPQPVADEIVKVFGNEGAQTAANMVLNMDEGFEFLKFYAEKTSGSDIFYHLNKKLIGNPQYLDVMIKHIHKDGNFGKKATQDLLITPLRDYIKSAAESYKGGKTKDSSYSNAEYQKYDYLNEPNANLKARSILGKISKEASRADALVTPAAVNMVEALIPYVGKANNKNGESLSTAWSELVAYLSPEKQNKIYEQFENSTNLSYAFVLNMALSSPEMWKKYGKFVADADGHKGIENNPINTYETSRASIFDATANALEARPEERLKLEPIMREFAGDNITDLYFQHKDLLHKLRHRQSSYARLINAPDYKAANFLDAFTEKMKDIAAEPEFAGNRDYECLSEAMDNNPSGFNQKAQETFEAMLQEKNKYFSHKINHHDNSFVRKLFPQIADKVDNLCKKLGIEDVNECLDYEKRYHKCAIGLYQYNKETIEALKATLSEEDRQYVCSGISSQIVYDMANSGVDNVFWAMNTIKVFKKLNGRPEIYNSSYNEYPVEMIVPYSKVNMPDWMYKVAIENQLPHQRLGSVKNLFDKCNAVKRAPHLASWASEAKQIGKMPLWYQVAAGAITTKLHEGVSEHEWKHNLELREIFWQEMKAVQEMGFTKAMQTYVEGGIAYGGDGEPILDSKDNYIPLNRETRQAVSALLEHKKIENDKEHYHSTINILVNENALDKMFAKEGKSKKLNTPEILKTRKIIAMREEFKKAKGNKQKINAIRDKHAQENAEATGQTPVKKTVENKISEMRKALMKAKQAKEGLVMAEAHGAQNIASKPINDKTNKLDMVVVKKLTDKIVDKK